MSEEIIGEGAPVSAAFHRTGRLEPIGFIKLGLDRLEWFQCVDCKTDFPVLAGKISCNGHAIDKCPWCRPDSAPWQNGRGA